MTDLRVPLPPELEPFRADLEYFVSTMVRKLHTNRHKGDAKDYDPRAMVSYAEREMMELDKALNTEGQFEAAVECADVANMMFLAARGIWHMTRQQFDEAKRIEA